MLPKFHLHVHLENAIRWPTLTELGRANGVDVPEHLVGAGYAFTSFNDFFDQNNLVRDCIKRAEDFQRIALEFCEDEAGQGTRYAEVTFTAAAHGQRLGEVEMPLEAVLSGLAEGGDRFGIQVQLVLDHSRRRSVEQARQTVELAARYAGRGVVAVGLAGDERFPIDPFADVFSAASERGLHIVHHAGEAVGPDSIAEALEVGRAERIGHGIRAIDNQSMVEQLIDRGIALEVCPTSNVALGFAPSLQSHPFPRMVSAGLTVTINTDIPAMINTTLTEEYGKVRDAFGYRDEEMAGFAVNGVNASFAPETLKREVRTEISEWLSGP
jgi:adenosine deaminase